MRIANARIREAVLNGVPPTGPPSLKSRWARARYISPIGINDAYAEAIKLVNKDAETYREQAKATPPGPEQDRLLSKSELHNPEVKYNHSVGALDLDQPVYRYLAKRDWAAREMLILMQRLEQHHVIPDTMPTLDPRAQVKLKFLTPTSHWLEPGKEVQNAVCERLPQLEIRDFTRTSADFGEGLYTVVIVNPDVPDLATDSFKTELHFAASNVSVTPSKPLVDWSKSDILSEYVPPHPEKNAPAQRLCVWVYKQNGRLDTPDLGNKEAFDIRQFAQNAGLDAIGAHLWRVSWDLSTPRIVEKYGLPEGNVYYRARTLKPEDALLHISDRQKWMKMLEKEQQAPKEQASKEQASKEQAASHE